MPPHYMNIKTSSPLIFFIPTLSDFTFVEFNDLDKCKEIWTSFVEVESLFDDWDYRYAFFDKNNIARFTVTYENNNPIALLPIQHNPTKQYFEFFGGSFMGDTRIFTKKGYEYIQKDLVKSIKENLKLICITPEDDFVKSLPIDEYLYKLNLENFKNLDDYYLSVSKKLRKNFRRSVNLVSIMNPVITMNANNHLDDLIKFNISKHESESVLHDPVIYNGFYNLLKTKFKVTMISILFDEVVQSVSFGIEFGDTYYALISGNNQDFVNNLGTFAKLQSID